MKYKGNIKYKCLDWDRGSCYAGGPHYLKYIKGTKVQAIKDSLGIMVFKTRRDAEEFASWHSKAAGIIRVKCSGRGRVPKVISSSQVGRNIQRFYEKLKKYGLPVNRLFIEGSLRIGGMQEAPRGTICYQEVEVLE